MMKWTVSASWFKAQISKCTLQTKDMRNRYTTNCNASFMNCNQYMQLPLCSKKWRKKKRTTRDWLCCERYFDCAVQRFSLVLHKPCRELLYMSSAYTVIMSHLTIFWASIGRSLGFYINMGREDPHLLVHRTPFSISPLTHMANVV